MSENNQDEIGALWLKTGKLGSYMTGTINGVKVVCFAQHVPPDSNRPNWRVLKSRPKAEATPSDRQGVARTDMAQHVNDDSPPDDSNDDMPF